MKISAYQFRLKYHTENAAKIAKARLEYIRQFGYTGEEDFSKEELLRLEYLDAIECHLMETAGRIDEALEKELSLKNINTVITAGNIDQVEDVLSPILALLQRMMLQLDFAEAKIRPLFKQRAYFCIHKWAEAIQARCAGYRDKYGTVYEELAQSLKGKLLKL